MATNSVIAPTQLPPVIASLSRKLETTQLSLEEFTAVLVMLKHESMFINAMLDKYTKNPISDNLKSVREIQTAFASLHSLLNRIDAGEFSHEK
jgi:hypothetical protein